MSTLTFGRRFTTDGVHPFNAVAWRHVDVEIVDPETEQTVFSQKAVEVPEFWSDQAAKVVASKYLRQKDGAKETSVRQLATRVATAITKAGVQQRIFRSNQDSEIFEAELLHLIIHQKMAFNSPVWFNVGIDEKPQSSACFIQSVEDNMESIMALAASESRLFKGGSGTGSNLSNIRSSWEKLSSGGEPSGPVSFMKGYDAFAGVMKSGGKTRRAAKLICLDVSHPDILEQKNGEPGFVQTKAHSEKVAQALIDAGFHTDFNKAGGAYDLVQFQNANHSVRVTDDFMQAVVADGPWNTRSVTTGEVVHTYKARELFNEIVKAAWESGDPGLQFDTAINDWHTCPQTARINASNPCQPGFAPVLTPKGIRTFDDVDVGSVIWSGTQWTSIKRKVSTGVKPVYRHHTTAGSFIGTNEHQVLSNGEHIEAQFAETIDTAVGGAEGGEFDPQTVVDGLG